MSIKLRARRGLGSVLDLLSSAGDAGSDPSDDGSSDSGDTNVGNYVQGSAQAVNDYANAVLPSSSGSDSGGFLSQVASSVQQFGQTLSNDAASAGQTASSQIPTPRAATSGGGLPALPAPTTAATGGSTSTTASQRVPAEPAMFLEREAGGVPVWAWIAGGVVAVGAIGIAIAKGRKKNGRR